MTTPTLTLAKGRFSKELGGVLLVSGTTIGAGMLAIPVTTGGAGFYPSALLLIAYWAISLCTAFLMLEVNLWFKQPVNLITMSRQTLGKAGEVGAWFVYLLLLYALTAAYLAGSGPMVSDVITRLTGYALPRHAETFPFLAVFGSCIYFGTRSVDYLNRILMVGLVLSYIVLLIFSSEHFNSLLIHRASLAHLWMAIPVISTSFGFHIIIPSLTTYLERDVKSLKRVIIIGSVVPLLVYLAWEFIVLGVLSADSLKAALSLGQGAERPLSHLVKSPWLGISARALSFFAIVTSFLGVGLGLFHFFADGLKIKQNRKGKALTALLTFSVPVLFVIFYPEGFIMALEYAGVCVALLLGILPVLMVWKGRKSHAAETIYKVPGGTPLLAALFVCFCAGCLFMLKEIFSR
jgi:tyrosine-specific transport protein